MKLNRWVVVFWGGLATASVAQAGFDEAVAAVNEGQYGIAYQEFSVLAEQDDARAQQALGWIYYEGQGRARDYQQAAFWYRKAADQDNITAQINLAQMYAYGQGVEQDFVEAAYWWEKLASQGDGRAQNALAELYYSGSGVTRSVETAARWWQEAAEQGIVAAQRHLGLMYGKGQGVVKDDMQAYAWLNAAALQDDISAEKSRDFALSLLSESQRTQAETLAAKYVEKFVDPFHEKNKKPH